MVNCVGPDDERPISQLLIQRAPRPPPGTASTNLHKVIILAERVKREIFYDLCVLPSHVAPSRYYLKEVAYWILAGHSRSTRGLHTDDFDKGLEVKESWKIVCEDTCRGYHRNTCPDSYTPFLCHQVIISIYWATALSSLARRYQLLQVEDLAEDRFGVNSYREIIRQEVPPPHWFTSEDLLGEHLLAATAFPSLSNPTYNFATTFFQKYKRTELVLIRYWLVLGGNRLIEETLLYFFEEVKEEYTNIYHYIVQKVDPKFFTRPIEEQADCLFHHWVFANTCSSEEWGKVPSSLIPPIPADRPLTSSGATYPLPIDFLSVLTDLNKRTNQEARNNNLCCFVLFKIYLEPTLQHYLIEVISDILERHLPRPSNLFGGPNIVYPEGGSTLLFINSGCFPGTTAEREYHLEIRKKFVTSPKPIYN